MTTKEYAEMCQKVSMLPSGIKDIKHDVPKELQVVYNSTSYYPFKYELWFNENGAPQHTAILHDLNSNSVIYARLDKIERTNDEDDKKNISDN